MYVNLVLLALPTHKIQKQPSSERTHSLHRLVLVKFAEYHAFLSRPPQRMKKLHPRLKIT